MNKLLVIVALLAFQLGSAQMFPYYKYMEMEENPEHNKQVLSNELYHYTKFTLGVEYIYDAAAGQYYKYETEHYKVKLSTDAAIEEFNKVYIPMENVLRIKKLGTRVIKKDEVVNVVPKVEEFYSEDEEQQYYYFPMSQLELGDEIEIMYTVQKEPDFDGDQFFFQSDIPILDFDFFFIAPNDSYFQFLAHNGLKKPVLVDTIIQRHMWTLHMDSIPAYEPEYFSEYNNTAMKLDASLRGFDSPTDKSYSPYGEFNKLLNGVYNISFEGKDLKALAAMNKEIGVAAVTSKLEQLRLIENFMKTDMLITADFPDQTMSEIAK